MKTHYARYFIYTCIINMYFYLHINVYIIGPSVYQCGEHWSGGPGSLVRGAKKKLSIPPIGCPQNLSATSVRNILCAISTDIPDKFLYLPLVNPVKPECRLKFFGDHWVNPSIHIFTYTATCASDAVHVVLGGE